MTVPVKDFPSRESLAGTRSEIHTLSYVKAPPLAAAQGKDADDTQPFPCMRYSSFICFSKIDEDFIIFFFTIATHCAIIMKNLGIKSYL